MAIVCPSGDSTGSRIQECQVRPFLVTRPFTIRTGSPVPSALIRMMSGIVIW